MSKFHCTTYGNIWRQSLYQVGNDETQEVYISKCHENVKANER